MKIELKYIEGDPNAGKMARIIHNTAEKLKVDFEYSAVAIGSHQEARILNFYGSPSVSINGRDMEDCREEDIHYGVRRYECSENHLQCLVECAILRALRPKHILFLCKHNGGRSPLAEAISLHYAQKGVAIESAGIEPVAIRSEVYQVLKEVNIDSSMLRSKKIDTKWLTTLELVISVCVEDVCPTFLAPVRQVTWSLKDPFTVSGEPDDILNAFRTARDTLVRRIQILLAYDPPEG